MKSKPIIRIVHEDLFNAEIVLVVCKWQELLDTSKKFLNPTRLAFLKESILKHRYQESVLATQFPFEGGGSLIWTTHNVNIGTLVHEIVHAAHYLLEKRDIPLSSDTEEVYAYLVEFLFNKLTRKSG